MSIQRFEKLSGLASQIDLLHRCGNLNEDREKELLDSISSEIESIRLDANTALSSSSPTYEQAIENLGKRLRIMFLFLAANSENYFSSQQIADMLISVGIKTDNTFSLRNSTGQYSTEINKKMGEFGFIDRRFIAGDKRHKEYAWIPNEKLKALQEENRKSILQ